MVVAVRVGPVPKVGIVRIEMGSSSITPELKCLHAVSEAAVGIAGGGRHLIQTAQRSEETRQLPPRNLSTLCGWERPHFSQPANIRNVVITSVRACKKTAVCGTCVVHGQESYRLGLLSRVTCLTVTARGGRDVPAGARRPPWGRGQMRHIHRSCAVRGRVTGLWYGQAVRGSAMSDLRM